MNAFLISTIYERIVLFRHVENYRAFRGFGKAKFTYGGSSLGSSQFILLKNKALF